MLLLIDNYDSFTYNLVQYLQMLGEEVTVYRHDALATADIASLEPDHILLSAGPCSPAEAGICVEIIQQLGDQIPILGICLGHQCIGAAFGAEIVKSRQLMHGKTCEVTHQEQGLFQGLPNPLVVTRYNSLTVNPDTLPDVLTVTATDPYGDIMGLQHKTLPIAGVQFHPESILSEKGLDLFRNFLSAKSVSKG